MDVSQILLQLFCISVINSNFCLGKARKKLSQVGVDSPQGHSGGEYHTVAQKQQEFKKF